MTKWIVGYLLIAFTALGTATYTHWEGEPVHEFIVSGQVEGYKKSGSGRHRSYYEVIAFEFEGKKHSFTSPFPVAVSPRLGKARQVAVNSAHPDQVRIVLWEPLERTLPYSLKQNTDVLLFWLFGCVIFGIGWFSYARYYEFFRRAIIIPGKVTSYDTRRRSKGRTYYLEIVSYTFDEISSTVTDTVSRYEEPKMGTVREVGVDPQNFRRARVRSNDHSRWVAALFGLGLWVIAIFIP